MAVRKSTVYFFVLILLGLWFGAIIYFGYDDQRLMTPGTVPALPRGAAAEFQLYAVLNARPDLPRPAAGEVGSLLVVLKNKNGVETKKLLLPPDEFSALRVIVLPAAGGKPTFNQRAGNPMAGSSTDDNGKTVLPNWHTLPIGPGQAIAREILLPRHTFPQPGEYQIQLSWDTDDQTRLEGHVAPLDRGSLVLQLEATVPVTIPPGGPMPKPAPAPGPQPATPSN